MTSVVSYPYTLGDLYCISARLRATGDAVGSPLSACNESLYPNVAVLLQVLAILPVTYCDCAALVFDAETFEDVSALVDGGRSLNITRADSCTRRNNSC